MHHAAAGQKQLGCEILELCVHAEPALIDDVLESELMLAYYRGTIARDIEDGRQRADPGLEANVDPVYADADLLEFAPAACGHFVVGIRCDEALYVRA